MESPLQHDLGAPLRRLATSRRALLRSSLALPPAVLVGVLSARTGLGRLTGIHPAAAQTPSCVVTPQLTEGPYFVDEQLFRSDIRSDPATGEVRDGVPLRLGFRISNVTDGGCTSFSGVAVDVWHCDALGIYSDVVDQMGAGFNTTGQQFLRGAQFTDAAGAAEFQSIYPGWYMGRAVHIHFKVRTDPTANTGYEFTSQLFFDDALSDAVFTRSPYSTKGTRDTRNSNDGIFQQGSEQLLLAVTEEGGGYAAVVDVGVDLNVQVSSAGPGGPGGPPPGGAPPGQVPPSPTSTPLPAASPAPARPVATPPAQRIGG